MFKTELLTHVIEKASQFIEGLDGLHHEPALRARPELITLYHDHASIRGISYVLITGRRHVTIYANARSIGCCSQDRRERRAGRFHLGNELLEGTPLRRIE